MIIRKCQDGDIGEILNLFRQFVKFHSERDSCFIKISNHGEFFAEWIKTNMLKDTSTVFVADDEGKIIGYCIAQVLEKPPVYKKPVYGYIDNICVDELYQRKGVGEGLFNAANEWFKSRGIERIELFAALTNERSTAFWRKMGLRPFMEQLYINL